MSRPKRQLDLMPRFLKPEGFDELNQRLNMVPEIIDISDDDDDDDDVVHLGTRKSQSNVKSYEKFFGDKMQPRIVNYFSKRQRIETKFNNFPQTYSFTLPPLKLYPKSMKATDIMSKVSYQTLMDKSPFDKKLIQNSGTSKPMISGRGNVTRVNSFEDLITINIGRIQTEERPLNHEKLGTGEDTVKSVKCDKGIKSDVSPSTMFLQKHQKRGVSFLEYLTKEEIELHIMRLKEGRSQKETTEEMSDNKDEEPCQLCGDDRILYPPPPLYCSSCSCRLKDNSFYYTSEEELNHAEHQFCSTCYRQCKSKFTLFGITFSKANMLKKNNSDNQYSEGWVQCESCKKWQHQICGLYNKHNDIDKAADYICPICLLKEHESINDMMRFNDNTNFGAKGLPETILSYFLEQRVFRRLKEEQNQTAKTTGKSINDVSEPDDLTLRVVYSAEKISTVDKQFANLLNKENYPTGFPYRSKVILLFQKVEGVDICIFAMFVQEYGSECSLPNQRSTYISYLDSVKYFRPERKTFTGEALRTFVYHEILIGYLEYCKLRGFTTAYIWACPPSNGDDYILYSHPKTQQTPNTKKLRQWYMSMLDKAVKENVVTNVTNLYDRFLVSTEVSSTCKTAARLPYFEESFWSSNAEFLIQEIEKKDNNEIQKDVKLLFKRKRNGMSYSKTDCADVDVDDAKNILLMQKLEKIVYENKDNVMVVEFNYSCTRCSKTILSGLRWFCDKCKNFQLCESCYDADPELPGEHKHNKNDKEKHQLSNVQMDGIPAITEDNDIIQENKMFESRQAFLSFSQEHNYNFDSLRRAKYSSMMIIYHLHTPNKDQCSQNYSRLSCNVCKKDISTKIYFPCLICSDYRACTGCYAQDKMLGQLHLFPIFPSINGTPPRTDPPTTIMVLETLKVIPHYLLCGSKFLESCAYPKCNEVKRLFYHNAYCKITGKEACCKDCIIFWKVIRIHAHHCCDLNCRVPNCSDLKDVLIMKKGSLKRRSQGTKLYVA